MAFQQSEGGLPHVPDKRAGHRQGEAVTSELQNVLRRSNGRAQRRIGQHPHLDGESGGENKAEVLP